MDCFFNFHLQHFKLTKIIIFLIENKNAPKFAIFFKKLFFVSFKKMHKILFGKIAIKIKII